MKEKLVGQIVLHKMLKEGTIVSYEDPYIQVSFGDKTSKFQYPEAFENFLTFADANLQKEAEELISQIKEEKLQQEKEAEEARRIAAVKAAQSAHSAVPIKRTSTENNLVFKCNYCDGGKTQNCIGFKGVCSDGQIQTNIEKKHHSWCSNPASLCSQYLSGKITREELEEKAKNGEFLCYEACILTDWKAEAGANLEETGGAKRTRRIQDAAANHLAVLTTRLPEEEEINRVIFGVFITGCAIEGDEFEAGYVEAKEGFAIELTPEEAKQMLFWNYYKNSNGSTRWGTGLYRYFKDTAAAKILLDIVNLKTGKEKEHAQKVLDYFLEKTKLSLEDISL